MLLPMPLPWPALWFMAATLFFAWDELYGGLYLLSGFVLFNRNFAYVHFEPFHLPLYITEYCLALWVLRVIVTRRQSFLQYWRSLPKSFTCSWLIFAGCGAFSFARGAGHYPLSRVLRDSALVYYSLIMLGVATLNLVPARLRQAMVILGSVILARTILCLWYAFGASRWIPTHMEFIIGQPAASAMVISLALLFGLSLAQLDLNSAAKAIGAALMGLMLLRFPVRSAWTGIWAGGILLLAYFKLLMPLRVFAWRFIRLVLFIAIVPIGLIYFIQKHPISTAGDVRPITFPAAGNTLIGSPLALVGPAIPVETQGLENPELFTELSEPVPVSAPFRPAVSGYNSGPWSALRSKFASLFQGTASANVSTRLFMWKDALSELFSVGLYSPHLQREDLKYSRVPASYWNFPNPIRIAPATLSGLQGEYSELYVSPNPSEDAPVRTMLRSGARAMIGIPFGRLYLPPEVIPWVISPGRYDPHNSLIAILYRLGVIGLAAFMSMVVLAFRHIHRSFRSNLQNPRIYASVIGVGSGLLYFLVHSLTDNTLENPFKGIWFWILMGLVFLIPRICARSADEA